MKITTEQLINSDAAMAELKDAKLPAATAMRVAVIMNAAQAPMKAFQDAYNDLLVRTGKPREEEPGKFDVVNPEQFRQESQELLAQVVELPGDTKITNLGSAELKPSTLLALSWLIELQEPS